MVEESKGLVRTRVQGSCCWVHVFRIVSVVLTSVAFKRRYHGSSLSLTGTMWLEFKDDCVAQDGCQMIIDRLFDSIIVASKVRVVVSG